MVATINLSITAAVLLWKVVSRLSFYIPHKTFFTTVGANCFLLPRSREYDLLSVNGENSEKDEGELNIFYSSIFLIPTELPTFFLSTRILRFANLLLKFCLFKGLCPSSIQNDLYCWYKSLRRIDSSGVGL